MISGHSQAHTVGFLSPDDMYSLIGEEGDRWKVEAGLWGRVGSGGRIDGTLQEGKKSHLIKNYPKK